MEVKHNFAFITLDDSRKEKKDAVREILQDWTEIVIPCVDGRAEGELEKHKSQLGVSITGPLRIGEYGVWFSQMRAWQAIDTWGEPVLLLEDDAILAPNFVEQFDFYVSQLPEDFGLFAAFVPENQYGDYSYEYNCDENGAFYGAARGYPEGAPSIVMPELNGVSRAYQGYGCVGNYISPLGARQLFDYTLDRGINFPVDCFIFEAYRAKKLDAYAFRPGFPRLIDVDWTAPTTIHNTDRIHL